MGKEEVDVQEVARDFKSLIANILEGSKSDQVSAGAPFKTDLKDKIHEYRKYASTPDEVTVAQKKLEVLKTGTFLDELFLNSNEESLNGIPLTAQIGVVGLSGVGKSILMQEVALKVACKGKRVLFVTSEDAWKTESARYDLQSRMKEKADELAISWNKIKANLLVLDTISESKLRIWDIFVETYRYLVENNGVDLLIIDSLSIMEAHAGALKRRILELSRYNQIKGVTALYVCQRSSEDPDSYAISGGQGVVHNLDVLLCIDFKKASGTLKNDVNRNKPKDKQVKQWDVIHFVRLMTCRLCGFYRGYIELYINNKGLLRKIV